VISMVIRSRPSVFSVCGQENGFSPYIKYG
jgi:hypothetical protein